MAASTYIRSIHHESMQYDEFINLLTIACQQSKQHRGSWKYSRLLDTTLPRYPLGVCTSHKAEPHLKLSADGRAKLFILEGGPVTARAYT